MTQRPRIDDERSDRKAIDVSVDQKPERLPGTLVGHLAAPDIAGDRVKHFSVEQRRRHTIDPLQDSPDTRRPWVRDKQIDDDGRVNDCVSHGLREPSVRGRALRVHRE